MIFYIDIIVPKFHETTGKVNINLYLSKVLKEKN